VGFDRNATLFFQIHGIEHLIFHVAIRNRARGLEQPVGKRGLPVVNVGDNAKVTDQGVGHKEEPQQLAMTAGNVQPLSGRFGAKKSRRGQTRPAFEGPKA
jgi:hypothetical protein